MGLLFWIFCIGCCGLLIYWIYAEIRDIKKKKKEEEERKRSKK